MAKTTQPDEPEYRPRLSPELKWRIKAAAAAARQGADEYLTELIERYLPPQFRKAAK